jgi:hypothetical protein
MGRMMETNRLPHPSSPFPKQQGELPLLGDMMPVSQGTIQRQPLFRGLSQELTADTAMALPATGAVIQPKLTLGTPGDMYEEEADRVARQVVDEIQSSAFREPNKLSPGERKPDCGEAGRVQRQITVRSAGDAGGELSSEWEGELQRAKSGGQPLSQLVKEPMERAFGADFGGLRVHTGAQADMLARSIQAKAFTTGQDVFFRQGAYEPGSRGGKESIAHELTQVKKQSGGAVQRLPLEEETSSIEGPGESLQRKEEEKANLTGLPDDLKAGVENLSGYSLDEVRVQYNSPKPAQLLAKAYTQGTEIHVAPGQEEHLPHEAWHVVQQMQGRVKPTIQMKGQVNINDDASLETEADVMGAKAMNLRLPEEQRTTEQTTSTLKTLAGSLNVFQMRWIDIVGTNQSYWGSRRPPGRFDLDDLARRGRVQVVYPYQSILNAPNANRPHGLFLAPRDSDLGEIGAPFPLNEPSSDQVIPQQERYQDVSWFHEGVRVQHSETRRSERTIHGGVSARQQLQQYGLPDYPGAAWAHIRPDHVTPEDQDREDRAMRHPSTEQANQQHTVREYAQMNAARNMGGIIASRHLHGLQPSRPGLYSSMEFGTTFLTGNETRTHSDVVPFFTQQPGRYGDEDEHAQMLSMFGFRALTSMMRDEGIFDENDLPNQFYIRHDDMDSDRSEEEDMSTGRTEQMEIKTERQPSGPGGGGGRPVIAPATRDTLNLQAMIGHYQNGIAWATNQGTFSPEFGQFRANAAVAFNTLVQAGWLENDAETYRKILQRVLQEEEDVYRDKTGRVPEYMPRDIQERIFDDIDLKHGRYLWALLRYLNNANN